MRTPYQSCKLIESTIKEIRSEYGKGIRTRKKSSLLKIINSVCKKNEINENCIIKVMGIY